MDYLFAVALIASGLLGASGLIVAKKPNAQRIIDMLVPFQALIGAGTGVLAVVLLLKWGPKNIMDAMKALPFFGLTMLLGVITGLMLGIMFALPLMGRLGAGQQKAAEIAQRLAPWQLMIGLVAIAAGLLLILFRSGIVPPNFPSNIM
jgi:hypothetical protein